jgi:catalase
VRSAASLQYAANAKINEAEKSMSDVKKGLSRRNVLVSATGLSVAGLLAATSASATPAGASAAEEAFEATADKVIDALEGVYGLHPGKRRNHTKGVGALGTFVGNSSAAELSRSRLFSGEKVEVVARFSIAGGNPDVSDADRGTRGLGLEFRLPGGALHHMTMLNTPMFFATVPQTFLDRFVAMKPDPATGKPDADRVGAFISSHPDFHGQATFLKDHNPPPSYANCAFYGIHTFKFVDRHDKTTMVRWRFVPRDGEKQLSDAELATMPADFLEKVLMERTRQGPIHWDMLVAIGEPGDPEDDSTVLWPTDRREINAGTLTVVSAMSDPTAGSYKINFDPLMMADGIAPTNDPVLLFRSPSYAVSHTRRLRDL